MEWTRWKEPLNVERLEKNVDPHTINTRKTMGQFNHNHPMPLPDVVVQKL